MFTRILFYDKFKNWLMPYDTSKYTGVDYFLRASISSVLCNSVMLFITYPLDLIHTRTSTDMSKKNTTRLYTTTFECFNRTNLEEGRMSLYKGAEIAAASALLRSLF